MIGEWTQWTQITLNALTDLWEGFLAFIPNLVGAIVVFVIGWMIAAAVGKAIEKILVKLNFNKLFEKEGWKEGIEEGIKEGIKETLVTLLEKKFSNPLPYNIKKKLESSSIENLKEIRNCIFELDSLDNVNELLKEGK